MQGAIDFVCKCSLVTKNSAHRFSDSAQTPHTSYDVYGRFLLWWQLWNAQDTPKLPQNNQIQYNPCSYQKYKNVQQAKGWKILERDLYLPDDDESED